MLGSALFVFRFGPRRRRSRALYPTVARVRERALTAVCVPRAQPMSAMEKEELYERLGVSNMFMPTNPTGRYTFDLSRQVAPRRWPRRSSLAAAADRTATGRCTRAFLFLGF